MYLGVGFEEERGASHHERPLGHGDRLGAEP